MRMQRRLGKTFYDLRVGMHMSQGEFAAALGVTQASVSKIENGKFNPRAIVLIRLARLAAKKDDALRDLVLEMIFDHDYGKHRPAV